MLHKLLFDTRPGEWLLSQLEQRAGLALIPADWLDEETVSPVEAVASNTGLKDTGTGPSVQVDCSTPDLLGQGG